MKQHATQPLSEVGKALVELISPYPLSALVTMSWAVWINIEQEIPERFEISIHRLVESIGAHCGEGVGCIGLLVPSPTGRLHAHFMLLKESGDEFSAKELARINRARKANTKAELIRSHKELYEYIASQHHIPNVKSRYIPLVFGVDSLEKARLGFSSQQEQG